MMNRKVSTIDWKGFSDKQKNYIKSALKNRVCVAEGAIRSGKTIAHCIIASAYLELAPDKFHLASGSTIANAKLNIGECNGFGLEYLFRGRCRWGKFKDNEALYINTQTGEKIVIFTGGGKADSYKRILGNSYGMWIGTEINEHYDCEDSRTSFVNVAIGRQAAAKAPFILWDLNPCSPNHRIYTNYIDVYEGKILGGYLHERFTMVDNLSISPERLKEIEAQYVKGSMWYKRDVLGERVIAQGLIYQQFADNVKDYVIANEDIPTFERITVGIDWGDNGSYHSFVATGITVGYKDIIVLSSERHNAKNLTPTDVENKVVDFLNKIIMSYGRVDIAYCDHINTYINGCRVAIQRNNISTSITYASKGKIKERILTTCKLLSLGRLKFSSDCESLVNALCSAVWDTKNPDTRLDDGTKDIDSLDSFEYSWSNFIRMFSLT